MFVSTVLFYNYSFDFVFDLAIPGEVPQCYSRAVRERVSTVRPCGGIPQTVRMGRRCGHRGHEAKHALAPGARGTSWHSSPPGAARRHRPRGSPLFLRT